MSTRRRETEELDKVREELASMKRQLRNTRKRLKQMARDYLLLKMPQGAVCAEIGVDEGEFSERILAATKPEKLHLVDPYQHQDEYEDSCYGGLGSEGQSTMDRKYLKVRQRFAMELESGQAELHRITAEHAASLFDHYHLDWLYLDANHLYEFVKLDLELFYPRIKPGGYICGDDYGVKGWWRGGVTRAVNEFVEENGLEVEVKATQFIIRKATSGAYQEQGASQTSDYTARAISMKSSSAESSEQQNASGAGEGSVPDCLIIGAQKAGTTTLYDGVLRPHPYFKAAAKKEIHYFDTPKFITKGTEWYRSNFPAPSWKNGRRILTGEASPFYLFHPHAARRAAETVPQAKIIVLLRNPVDRALSDYWHRASRGREHLDFEAAVQAEEERLRGEREKILVDESYVGRNYRRYSYLSRGIYVDQLAEWHEYFAEDQMLILKSEDFFQNSEPIVESVLDFLDLPSQETGLTKIAGKGSYDPMNPDTRRRLERYFEPHNQRLYEYLGRDFGW